MKENLAWLDGTGLNTESGISYTGGGDKYLSALQRFYKNHEKNRDKVEKALAAKDLESLGITAHALKSNTKMIGADALSLLFEELETAAKNGEADILDKKTPAALSEYAALIGKLSPLGDMEDLRAEGEISADTAKETAKSLLLALDDFDDEEALRLAKKLSGYPFRMTQAAKLKEATGYIEDFQYEEAADLVREILPAIE